MKLENLARDIRACQICRGEMDRAPNPVFQISATARILIAGQAPGNLADVSGIPFSDPSGRRLRDWMSVSDAEFYDSARIALVPMGFCFPGYDKNGGDRPPMRQCAETWRHRVLDQMPKIELKLLIGTYAQKWHLGRRREKSLTATLSKWRNFLDDGIIVMPHPSWRNTAWLKRNPMFEDEVLPELRKRVRALLS